jgi:ketosteroid isomerase-like protein
MSSCSGVGALVTITAFGVEAYEEARLHRPDLKLEPLSTYLPDLKFSAKQSATIKKTKTSTSNAPVNFGFDCSKLEDEKKQSKCFNDFSKILAQQDNKSLESKDVVIQKKEERLTTLQKVAKTIKALPANTAKKLPSSQSTSIKKEKESITLQGLPASFIQNWASAWEKKDVFTYLSFYSKEFKGSKNHRGAWEASRQRALKKNKNISIELSNLQFQQNGKGIIKVNFTQIYKSEGFSDTGNKELTLLKKDTGWKIVKELWSPTNPTIITRNSNGRTKQINEKLTSWIKAWENKDVHSYLSFYSDKFRTSENSHIEWLDSRHLALGTKKNLTINTKSLIIVFDDSIANSQHYNFKILEKKKLYILK